MKRHTLRGYTLIELAMAIALLGLVAVLLWRFGSMASQRIAETEAPQTLADANQALVGFVAANSRLPCPDTNGDGVEDCAGDAVGMLPVVTLGLGRADLRNIRYGVYRSTLVNMDAASDRFAPLVTWSATSYDPGTGYDFGSVSASDTLLGQINGVDYCHALRQAGRSAANPAALKIRVLNSGGTSSDKNVAYALALPGARDADGDGNPFDGANASAGTFAAPGQPLSAPYDDVVQTVNFGQLFDRLSCGSVLSAADHAHFNAATAAALTHAGFVNYKTQLQVAKELADANAALAGAGVAMATADLASASAGVVTAVAKAMATAGLTAALIAQSAWDEGLAIAGEALAIAGLATAADAAVGADKTVTRFQDLLDESAALETETRANAFTADAAGLY